jgi:hypothetical protein
MTERTEAEPDEILALLNRNAAQFTPDELRLYERMREWDEQHPGDEKNNPQPRRSEPANAEVEAAVSATAWLTGAGFFFCSKVSFRD